MQVKINLNGKLMKEVLNLTKNFSRFFSFLKLIDLKFFIQDHLHVYQRNGNETLQKNSYSVPFHKDRGLILYVSHSPDHPVQIKNKEGTLLNTSNLDMNSVIVILGSGLTDWLLENSQLHASSHGVPSLTEQLAHRVVVARMKVEH